MKAVDELYPLPPQKPLGTGDVVCTVVGRVRHVYLLVGRLNALQKDTVHLVNLWPNPKGAGRYSTELRVKNADSLSRSEVEELLPGGLRYWHRLSCNTLTLGRHALALEGLIV